VSGYISHFRRPLAAGETRLGFQNVSKCKNALEVTKFVDHHAKSGGVRIRAPPGKQNMSSFVDAFVGHTFVPPTSTRGAGTFIVILVMSSCYVLHSFQCRGT